MTRQFGTTRVLPSGRVQARYRDRQGRQKTVGTFASEEGARERLSRIQQDMDRDTFVDDSQGRITFAEFAEIAMKHRERTLKPGTITNDRGHLRLRLLPAFGHLELRQITKRRLAVFLDNLEGSDNTRRNTWITMSAILTYAVELDELTIKPTVRGAMRATAKAPTTYGLKEFQKLLDVAPADFVPILWTMLASHVRIGELRALKREDLDLEAGTLSITKQLRAQTVTTTKTNESRTVVLLQPGVDALGEYLAKNPRLPRAALFSTWRGKHLSDSYFRKVWEQMRLDAGLPDIKPHSIRHIGLSFAAHSGHTLNEVMQRAGHNDLRSSLHYMHSNDERQREAAQKTSAALMEKLA